MVRYLQTVLRWDRSSIINVRAGSLGCVFIGPCPLDMQRSIGPAALHTQQLSGPLKGGHEPGALWRLQSGIVHRAPKALSHQYGSPSQRQPDPGLYNANALTQQFDWGGGIIDTFWELIPLHSPPGGTQGYPHWED